MERWHEIFFFFFFYSLAKFQGCYSGVNGNNNAMQQIGHVLKLPLSDVRKGMYGVNSWNDQQTPKKVIYVDFPRYGKYIYKQDVPD